MSKFSKIITLTWLVLALMSFITAFFLPTFPKIINITFGVLNIITVLSYVITMVQNTRLKNKIKDLIEEENGMSMQEEESEETSGE